MSNNKKGTQKTELIIGTAASKLSAAVKGIQEASQTAVQLEQTLTDYNLKVTDLEGKITGLEQEYQNKKAQQEFQLDLDFKTSQRQFAEKFLQENGYVAVVVEDNTKLKEEYETLKANFEAEVNKKVGAATNSIQSNVDNKIKLLEAEYRAKEASNIAEIANLKSQLAFANQMAEKWETQLKEERQASVERSKSQSATVNVTGQNGR